MPTTKLDSGGVLPDISLPLAGGGQITLGEPDTPGNWRLVFIYRGLHCPICYGYLAKLEALSSSFIALGAEMIAVSGDPAEKAEAMVEGQGLSFPLAYDLSVDQMKQLGLWISEPRPEEDIDRPFAEPALFGINSEGRIQLIDQSNTPFNRADPDELLETVEWIKENGYPIRGTYDG